MPSAIMSHRPRKRCRLTADLDQESVTLTTRVPLAKKRESARIAQKQPPFRFFDLPREIRHMVLREHFNSYAKVDRDERVVLRVKILAHGSHRNKTALPKILGRDDQVCRVLNLLLVSKQFNEEAQFVFYLNMTLCFDFLDELPKFCNQKLLPTKTRRRNLPQMFPITNIHHIVLDVYQKNDTKIRKLASLWTLARYSRSDLDLKINVRRRYWARDCIASPETSSLPQLFADIKAFQANLTKAGVSLRISRKEMQSWIDETKKELIVCFPDANLWLIKIS